MAHCKRSIKTVRFPGHEETSSLGRKRAEGGVSDEPEGGGGVGAWRRARERIREKSLLLRGNGGGG